MDTVETVCPHCGNRASFVPLFENLDAGLCSACGEPIIIVDAIPGRPDVPRARDAQEGNERLAMKAAYRFLHLSHENVAMRYSSDAERVRYPGLDTFISSADNSQRWLDIAPALLLSDSQVNGTLILTDTHLHFIDSVAAMRLSRSVEDTVSVGLKSTRKLLRKAANITIQSQSAKETYMVGRSAAVELDSRISILRRWPLREKIVHLSGGMTLRLVKPPAGLAISWEVIDGDDSLRARCFKEFFESLNQYAEELGCRVMERREAQRAFLYPR